MSENVRLSTVYCKRPRCPSLGGSDPFYKVVEETPEERTEEEEGASIQVI